MAILYAQYQINKQMYQLFIIDKLNDVNIKQQI